MPLQRLPSSQLLPETAFCTSQLPLVGLHAFDVHGLPVALQVTGVPVWQTPAPSQVSMPLQRFASAQLVPATEGTFEQPVPVTHESTVHGLASLHESGVPAAHAPVPSHVSLPLQGSPSLHESPATAFACVHPVAGSHASVVHGLASVHESAVPVVQVPALSQVS
jgi:hypothetical protein